MAACCRPPRSRRRSPRRAACRVGIDCISPPGHSAFSTPIELLQFVVKLRELSGGKPAGFKLCIGHPWEFLSICKAMVETGIVPDFIVIDGAEGARGRRRSNSTDHIGMPLRDGLLFAHNALVGIGVRDRLKLGASGKIVSAFDIARTMALGADWCNSARGLCSRWAASSRRAATPTAARAVVATQDPQRQKALVVEDKAERVARFHRSTLHALAEVIAAAGLEHPQELRPWHFSKRVGPDRVESFDRLYRFLAPSELLAGTDDPRFRDAWPRARPDSFSPADSFAPAGRFAPPAGITGLGVASSLPVSPAPLVPESTPLVAARLEDLVLRVVDLRGLVCQIDGGIALRAPGELQLRLRVGRGVLDLVFQADLIGFERIDESLHRVMRQLHVVERVDGAARRRRGRPRTDAVRLCRPRGQKKRRPRDGNDDRPTHQSPPKHPGGHCCTASPSPVKRRRFLWPAADCASRLFARGVSGRRTARPWRC